jgi:2-amino-4-hydroxy-6-hydroxymethyldihydropteridine diphosphokinase
VTSTAYIGLGANLGDPIEQILSATRIVQELPMVVACQRSSLYISSPVGYQPQNDFVNCVLKVMLDESYGSSIEAMQLLFEHLQSIESDLGRQRLKSFANGPRAIDCDLLFFDHLTSDDPSLNVPHPRAHERLFVLLPLQELEAQCVLSNGRNVSEQLVHGDFTGQEIYRLGDPLPELIA